MKPKPGVEPTLPAELEGEKEQIESRRRFLQILGIAASSVGLSSSAGKAFAKTVESGLKPSIIWLHFQECTGCTESILRASHPDIATLILDLVSLDYHETLFAASGRQLEQALDQAMKANAGRYLLVVEGSIPTADRGVYCRVGGRNAVDTLKRCSRDAAAVIAIGSCASWGGVSSAVPNPTGAAGAPVLVTDKPVVTLPGCPANPYNLLGTVLQFATYGTLPKLDERGRPLSAYAHTIHHDCPRRHYFEEGRFATRFGDEGHRQGWCLYLLGCKGPVTHASCSLLSFAEVPGAWPVGIGHPCIGCTEPGVGFHIPIHDVVEAEDGSSPGTQPGPGRTK